MHSRIISETLPIDQCLAVMDFSQNITLVQQDEIESANWTQKQVILHQIFLVRHSPESTGFEPHIIIYGHLNHNPDAVYVFIHQLLLQYKRKDAFHHIDPIEKKLMGLK